ncbi:uncharacterized protein LOC112693857 isoform X2 [Sipha flava]|uniref:Uncharacterized protein LOC112693857 isoform X2 n=1 Tax=Sipha flava TaxID=143950 RepID=A0A8B8GNP8_9HEMI|nr:uncharacterized protein LOC112693857 isoform X2 [Sipha flava]
MFSNVKLIFLLMTICILDNTYASQTSCEEKINQSFYLRPYLGNSKNIEDHCKSLQINDIEELKETEIGVVYRYVKYLHYRTEGPIEVQEWCDTYEEKTCVDSFNDFHSFKNCTTIECVVENINKFDSKILMLENSVLQRYADYIKFEIQNESTLRTILFWNAWCNKIENLCMEPIRMLGFTIEVYAIAKLKNQAIIDGTLKNYDDAETNQILMQILINRNKQHANEINMLEIPFEDYILKWYIDNLRDEKVLDIQTYCLNACNQAAAQYNITDKLFSPDQKFSRVGRKPYKKPIDEASSSSLKRSNSLPKEKKPISNSPELRRNVYVPGEGTETMSSTYVSKERESTNTINLPARSNMDKGFLSCFHSLQEIIGSFLIQKYSKVEEYCLKECM